MIIAYLRQLLKPKYPTLNRLEINKEAILYNLRLLQNKQPQAQIIPVVKSNAYGHGLKEICKILNESGLKMIALDSFPEAQIAYRYFRGKILLIGEMPIAAYRHLRWSRTEICVYNSLTLRALAALGVSARIHLFVNSGMNREGIKDLPSFWREQADYWPKLKIVGLCSHLADAEGNSDFNQLQQECFFKDLDFLHSQNCYPASVHLGNSAGVFVLSDKRLTAFRPGLAIYGYNPFPNISPYFSPAQELKPALSLISTVVSLQDLHAGESVSYNATYSTKQATQIAVIPFGYYEGLDRRLSDLAEFQVLSGKKKIKAKLAGRVCMNLSCLDVGREETVKPGMEVLLVSPRRDDPNSLENLAYLQKSIAYEFLVKLQPNIRRIII
jgi:alanine racemase